MSAKLAAVRVERRFGFPAGQVFDARTGGSTKIFDGLAATLQGKDR